MDICIRLLRIVTDNICLQCAIVLKTPPYIDKAIQTAVTVWMQLKRGKDNVCSEPIPFMYKPVEYGKAFLWFFWYGK